MSIKERAMLVQFNSGLWTAKKMDKKVTAEICSNNHTTSDWARGYKSLVENEAVKKVQKVISDARTWHYEHTLPWGDNGDRLLPSEMYFKYQKAMGDFKARFEQEVADFLNSYESLIEQARVKLNGLFNEADYPKVGNLRSKFYYQISVFPIPVSDDFRVGLNDEEVGKIRASIDEAYNSRLKESIGNIYKRVFDALNRIVEKLGDKEGVFRDSLIENVQELCEILPSLNVTGDLNIEELISEIKESICKVDPDTLRVNKRERNNTKEKAEALINKMKGFYNA
jgi:hypothetical protein